MRLKLACLTFAAASLAPLALTANAQQGYRSSCNSIKQERQAMGAVLGGLAGGLIGNQSAGRGARDEGTALGLVVGAITGSQLAKGDLNCSPTVYGQQQYGYDPYASGYQSNPYGADYGGYSSYPAAGSTDYGQYRYQNRGDWNRSSYDAPYRHSYEHTEGWNHSNYRVAAPPRENYNHDYDFAGRECADAKQITRLPDGTEIHRPIEACREAYYGDWSVED